MGNEGLDWSDPASRAVGHSRDMGLAESTATIRIGSGEAIGQ